MKDLVIGLSLLGMVSACSPAPQAKDNVEEDYCQYVNPFIGNADNGHTFPGACAPFGLIQASPESGVGSWRYCSGYNYDDNFIEGFAQTHLNGTGCPDLGDILLFPFSGDIKDNTYKSEYDKSTQKASPGYYAVTLSDYGVDAEITATAHTALHRYKYNNEGPARLLVDLQRGMVGSKDALKTHVLEAELEMPDNQTITGHNQTRAWVTRHYFYVIKFDRPYTLREELPAEKGEKAKRLILEFDTKPGEAVQVKIAMSSVSVDGALASLQKENPAWDFDAVHQSTRDQWQALLSRAQVTGTTDEKTSFYTSMYHLMMQPNNIADIDGRYRGIDDNIHTSPTGEYYSTFSLWDTYRAAHPLYTILNPDKVDAMIQTMLDHPEDTRFPADLGFVGQRELLHDRQSRHSSDRGCLPERIQRVRCGRSLSGSQSECHRQPFQLRLGNIREIRLLPVRHHRHRIGFQDFGMCLRRLLCSPNGKSIR